MWLDQGEFDKCDQHVEAFPVELLRMQRCPNVLIDRSKTRACPKCEHVNLTRVVIDHDKRFEVDECPSCHGHWLDLGELEYLRDQDREMSQIQARMDAYDRRVHEQLSDLDKAYRVKSLVKKVVG
jgi:Zn-finger nucleic acid-binding protein